MSTVIKLLFAAMLLLNLGCQQAKSSKDQADEDAAHAVPAVSEEEKLPDFTLASMTGQRVNLRSLEGKHVVVVNFWATWCGPCRMEIPDFNKIYATYRDKGLEILGVSLDHAPEQQVSAFMRSIPIDYPVLLGSPQLGAQYQIQGLPTTFIVDRNGRVVWKRIGLVQAGQLQYELDKLL